MLEDVYRSVIRRWRVLVGVAVTVLAAGIALGLLWPDRYTATAATTVEAIATSQESTPDVNMETQRLIASSTEVLTLAAVELGEASVPLLRSELEVTVPRGAQVLEFSVTSPSSVQAAARANAVATAYLENRRSVAARRVAESSDALAATVEQLSTQVSALPPESPARLSLESQIRALEAERVLLAATTFDVGTLIDPAVEPNETNTPGLYVFAAAGLFLGIFLGAFAALIVDRLRRDRRSTAVLADEEALTESRSARSASSGRSASPASPPRDGAPDADVHDAGDAEPGRKRVTDPVLAGMPSGFDEELLAQDDAELDEPVDVEFELDEIDEPSSDRGDSLDRGPAPARN